MVGGWACFVPQTPLKITNEQGEGRVIRPCVWAGAGTGHALHLIENRPPSLNHDRARCTDTDCPLSCRWGWVGSADALPFESYAISRHFHAHLRVCLYPFRCPWSQESGKDGCIVVTKPAKRSPGCRERLECGFHLTAPVCLGALINTLAANANVLGSERPFVSYRELCTFCRTEEMHAMGESVEFSVVNFMMG